MLLLPYHPYRLLYDKTFWVKGETKTRRGVVELVSGEIIVFLETGPLKRDNPSYINYDFLSSGGIFSYYSHADSLLIWDELKEFIEVVDSADINMVIL